MNSNLRNKGGYTPPSSQPLNHMINPSEILEKFLEAIVDGLVMLETELNVWKSKPRNQDQLEKVYQIFHRIKYHSHSLRGNILHDLANAGEELLEQVRFHYSTIQTFPIDLFEKTTEAFMEILRCYLLYGNQGEKTYQDLLSRLENRNRIIKQLGK